jgi:hypothetical protein
MEKKKSTNEIPDLYRIKIWREGNPKDVRFGIVERYDEDAKNYWKEKKLLVADAITGHLFLVQHDDPELVIEDQPLKWGKSDPETRMSIDTEYDRLINDAYKEACEKHKAAGKGVKAGKLCSVGVADGCAMYVITKVNKKTCKVEWRAFGGGDNYVDRRWGYESTVPLDDAQMYIQGRLQELL